MKWLALLLLLLASAHADAQLLFPNMVQSTKTAPPVPIAPRQSNYGYLGDNGTSGTVTMTSTPTAGDTLLVSFWGCGGASCINSLTSTPFTSVDIDGVACTHVTGGYLNAGPFQSVYYDQTDLFRCGNIAGGSPGVVTAHFTTDIWYVTMFVDEFSCGATHCALDSAVAQNQAAGGLVFGLSITVTPTSYNRDLIWSFGSNSNCGGTCSITPDQTALINPNTEYQIAGGAGIGYTNSYTGIGTLGIFGIAVALSP